MLERIDTSVPLWWLMLGATGLVTVGAARGRRGMLAAGITASAVGMAAFEDIARSPVVPGANDNLTAVAALVALAERVRVGPLLGLRLLLVSCGAEEVIQGGIYGFARRHFPALDRDRTVVSQPRHGRFAEVDPARGRGSGGDGGLPRPQLP